MDSCHSNFSVTFIVNEDIAIKAISKKKDVIGISKINICSWVEVGKKTATRVNFSYLYVTFKRKIIKIYVSKQQLYLYI